MHIIDTEDGVGTLQPDYCHAMKAARYRNLTTSKPHMSIRHVLQHLKLYHVRNIMDDIFQFRGRKFDKEDFSRSICKMAQQAEKLRKNYTGITKRMLPLIVIAIESKKTLAQL